MMENLKKALTSIPELELQIRPWTERIYHF